MVEFDGPAFSVRSFQSTPACPLLSIIALELTEGSFRISCSAAAQFAESFEIEQVKGYAGIKKSKVRVTYRIARSLAT